MIAQPPSYTDYHPRWRRQHVSTYWWLEKRSYFAFILREASCVFIAWFVAYLLMLVQAASQGPAAYQQFLDWSTRPGIVVLNVVTLVFVLFHAITFFDAAPRALVLHVRGRRIGGAVVAAAHYAALAAASAIVIWLLDVTP